MPRPALLPPLAALVVLPAAARAQPGWLTPEPTDLAGRQALSLGLGAARVARAGGLPDETQLLAQARLTAWLRPTWALDVSAARLPPTAVDALTPLLAGMAWYPAVPPAAARTRPYASAAVGFVLRSVRRADPTSATSFLPARTDGAPAGRLAVGFDAVVGRRYIAGAQLGYYLSGRLPALDARYGAPQRANGPSLTVTAGILLPRGEY